MNPDDRVFLEKTRNTLDESAQALDAATLSRLNQNRQQVLQQQHSSAPASVIALVSNWQPVILSAMAVLVLAVWLSNPGMQQVQQSQLVQHYEDLELLTSDADIELLDELDFLSWLLVEELSQDVMEGSDAG